MRTAFWQTAGLLLAAALPLGAQDPAAGGLLNATLLNQVRAHMVQTLAQQPNYTCLETVERSSRSGHEKDYHVDDLLKLEVALVDGKEMFAWPGSKQFEDTDMRTFVPTGMFGSGDFGLYANTVFGGRSNHYQFQGQGNVGSNATVRFSFQVPIEDGMRIRAGDKLALASYHGSFYAEPESLDVLRLEVEADELSKSLDLREVTDTMEYARVKIGTGDFLLPAAAEVVMVDVRGDASRNRIRFSACREFAGESKLSFGDPDASAADGQAVFPVKREIRLPKNAELTFRLVDDIDMEHAAVGDLVRAALNSDVKVKGQIVLPKGTPATGRIVRLERFANFTVLGLMFQDAESEKAHAALDLKFDMAEGADLLGRGVPWGTRSPVRPHEGLVPLRPGRLRVGRGLLLLWRT
jgi:hypothetical protein